MIIRKIRTENPINNVSSHFSNDIVTIPDQSIKIKDLFSRQQSDQLERLQLLAAQNQILDGKDVTFDDYIPNLDAVETYERLRYLGNKYKQPGIVAHANTKAAEKVAAAVVEDKGNTGSPTSPTEG